MKGLSFGQLLQVFEEINNHHNLVEGRSVKYVDVSFDFRTRSFWRILIRPFGVPKEFSTANRNMEETDPPESLYAEIMCWLLEGRDKK